MASVQRAVSEHVQIPSAPGAMTSGDPDPEIGRQAERLLVYAEMNGGVELFGQAIGSPFRQDDLVSQMFERHLLYVDPAGQVRVQACLWKDL